MDARGPPPAAPGGGGSYFRQLRPPGSVCSSRPQSTGGWSQGIDGVPFSPFTSVELGSTTSTFRCAAMQTASWPTIAAWSGTSSMASIGWGQIVVPDDGPENDSLRLRNGGKPLYGRRPGEGKVSPRQLRRTALSASAPSLHSTGRISTPGGSGGAFGSLGGSGGALGSLSGGASTLSAGGAIALGSCATPGGGGGAFGVSGPSISVSDFSSGSPKGGRGLAETLEGVASASPSLSTPRTQNGLLRKSSSLYMMYPSDIEPQPVPERPPRVRNTEKLPSHLVKGGKVVFKEPETAMQRTTRLLNCLFQVRRAGQEHEQVEVKQLTPEEEKLAKRAAAGPPPAPKAPSKKGPEIVEEDAPLLQGTLRSREDNATLLGRAVEELAGAGDACASVGATRHASTVVAQRTYWVVRRKHELLLALEGRYEGFKKAHDARDELLVGVIKNTAKAPPEMQNIKPFVQSLLHKGGQPWDADKSDFRAFTSTFGLPHGHKTAVALDNMGKEASKWWADRALEEAKKGAEPNVIIRILDVMKGLGVEVENAASKECLEILSERLANQVLEFAKMTQEKDALAVERNPDTPQIASARKGSEAINEQIVQAFELGGDPKHRKIEEARKIANELAKEGNIRVGLKALKFAEGLLKKDTDQAAQIEAKGKIPEVGPATKLADDVEREVNNAEKDGAPRAHAYMAQAMGISKELRDRDGTRKRLEAREKRQAEKG